MSNLLSKYQKAFKEIKELMSGIDPYEIACLDKFINEFESSLNDEEPEEEHTDTERLDFLLLYFYTYDNDGFSEPIVKIDKELKEKLSLCCQTHGEDLREIIDKCLEY